MVPKFFSVAIVFLLLLLAIYGMTGAIFNYRELMKKSYSHRKWPFNQKPIYIVFMSIQLCYLIPAILGLISVVKNIKDYLTYSFFILLGIFTFLLVFGGVCLRISSTDLRTDLYNAFRKNLMDDADLDWLFDVQYRCNCCGVFSYLDWGLFNVTLPNGNTSLPDSCCRKEIFIPPVNCGVGYLTPSKSRAEAADFIYTDGCGTEISDMLWNNSKWIGTEMIIAALITLGVAAMVFYDTLISLSANQHDTSRRKNHNGDTTNNFDVNNNVADENNAPIRSERSKRSINKNVSSNTPSSSNNKPKPPVVINVKREKSSKPSHHKKSKGSNNKFGGPEGSRCGRKEQGVNPRNLFRKYWNPAGSNENLIINKGARPNSTVNQKLRYPNGYDVDLDGSVTGLMRRNLEMLMDPIAGNFSTLSTTPKPSGSLNFSSALQNSASPNPRGKFEEKVLQEPNLSHYSSLPLVNTNILTNLNAIQITNALQALLPFCSGSHYHRYLPPKFSKHSSEPGSPGVNFLPGKFTSPSMTHSTTLATIQEETESLKSGAGSASPKGASPNTTPQSLSQKTSSSSADDYNASQPYSDVEGSPPKGIIIEIVDEKQYQDSSNPCEMEETKGAFGINDTMNEANNFGISNESYEVKSNENISKLFLEFQDVNENTNSSFQSFNGLNSMGTDGMSVDNQTNAHQENVNVDLGNDIMCRRDLSTNCMTDDVSLNMEILSGHENMSSIVQNSI